MSCNIPVPSGFPSEILWAFVMFPKRATLYTYLREAQKFVSKKQSPLESQELYFPEIKIRCLKHVDLI